MEKTQLPVDTMAGAEWNVLNAGGMRVAICGTDNNHTVDGPKDSKGDCWRRDDVYHNVNNPVLS